MKLGTKILRWFISILQSLSVCQYIYLFVCFCIYFSLSVSVSLCLCLSVSVSLSLSLSLSLSYPFDPQSGLELLQADLAVLPRDLLELGLHPLKPFLLLVSKVRHEHFYSHQFNIPPNHILDHSVHLFFKSVRPQHVYRFLLGNLIGFFPLNNTK